MDNNMLLDFLTFSYFGLTYSEIKGESIEQIAVICARRAYLDLARTLTYQRKNSEETDNHKTDAEQDDNTSFKENICDCLGKRISAFFGCRKSDNIPSQKDFDRWHDNVCSCITACGRKSIELVCRQSKKHENEKFYYGQAQKWLNMTLKYMMLLNVEGICAVHDYLHVPIDQYILKAAAEKNNNGKYALQKKIAPQKHSGDDKTKNWIYFVDGKTQPWSQLNQEDYKQLQKNIRDIIGERNREEIKCPLDWEAKAWIEQAQKERKKP